jgi:hypothetical protein
MRRGVADPLCRLPKTQSANGQILWRLWRDTGYKY